MYILGISETDNDAGAVLLHGSSVVCGVSEEIADWCHQHVKREKMIRMPHHYAHAVCTLGVGI